MGWKNLGEKPVVETPWFQLKLAEDLAVAAAREALQESGWEPVRPRLLMRLEPSSGLTDAVHHVYWTEQVIHRGPGQATSQDL